MGLKIIKASEPITVERLNVCLYGAPGTGKTTAAFSCANPLLLDFDKGAYRAGNRKDVVSIDAWGDVENLTASDLKGYSTIVVDTAGRALDALTIDIIAASPKHGRAGALTLQGYGVLKSRFGQWLKSINSFGKDVILIAHMDEQKNGDDLIERLDVQGGSKNEIYKSVDAMGRISVTAQGRLLDFNPTSAAYGKSPGQLEPVTIPNISTSPEFMADVIAQIKARLNEQTEEQRKAQAEIAQWQETVKSLKTADDFNEAVSQVRDAEKAVKLVVSKAAEAAGMAYNKQEGQYIDATQPEAVPEESAA